MHSTQGVQGVRNGDTARLCEALSSGPKSAQELAAITGMDVRMVPRRLRQRAALRGDVEWVDGVWRVCARIAPPPRQPRVRKVRTGAAAVKARAERAVVCEVATSRTYVPAGEYRPARGVVRPGSLDYQRVPSRYGEHRVEYRGLNSISPTTRDSTGSGLK